jgi:hypothetical protein
MGKSAPLSYSAREEVVPMTEESIELENTPSTHSACWPFGQSTINRSHAAHRIGFDMDYEAS